MIEIIDALVIKPTEIGVCVNTQQSWLMVWCGRYKPLLNINKEAETSAEIPCFLNTNEPDFFNYKIWD